MDMGLALGGCGGRRGGGTVDPDGQDTVQPDAGETPNLDVPDAAPDAPDGGPGYTEPVCTLVGGGEATEACRAWSRRGERRSARGSAPPRRPEPCLVCQRRRILGLHS